MKQLPLILLFLLGANTAFPQSVKKIIVNEKDSISGYYLAVEPKLQPGDSIQGVLVLLSGFSQHAESIFPETKLPNVAYANNILTICFAAGFKLYADPKVQAEITAILKDVIARYKVRADKFIFGGYSAGGTIALRYTELCNQYPSRFPVRPKGVFLVDSPIDIFTLWDNEEEAIRQNFSEAAVEEAKEAIYRMQSQYGIPAENIEKYSLVSPFCMNKAYGENEKYLSHTAVRTYHDVDIAWRIVNRRQTVRNANFLVTAELINRLMILGNDKAEFIQCAGKAHRSNGMRHPHSWSVVEEVECLQWMKGLLG